MRLFGDLLFSFFVGLLLPIQASINATLLDPLNNAMAPGFVSFFGGSVVLSLVYWIRPAAKESKKTFEIDSPRKILNKDNISSLKTVPVYLLIIPGLLGALYVAFAAFLGDKVGYSLFFVSLICGQMLSSLTADRIGLFGLQKIPPTKFRLFAVFFVILGSLVSVLDRLGDSLEETNLSTGELILYTFLSVCSGLGFGIQSPMNHKVVTLLKTFPHRVTLLSFTMGTLWLIPAIFIAIAFSGEKLDLNNLDEIEVWKFWGGPLGTIFVFATPRIGLGVFLTLCVAGQLVSSLLIDTFGLIEAEKVDLTATRVVGVVIVYIAVVLFRFESKIKGYFEKEVVEEEKSKERKTSEESSQGVEVA
eukprot:snap_masked-scaffold_17-processed-gene-5.32-mRNA-1 protein AED:1.00 eAED:1.00 QI:0/0/0/0/1/1/2/0/360